MSKNSLNRGIEKGNQPAIRGGKEQLAAARTQHELISVVIPAKDEAASLGYLIPAIRDSLAEYQYEIIVVDDGSSDKTREISFNSKAKVISQGQSLGKGAAMKTGAHQAIGEVIVFIDGDGAHDPKDIPRIAGIILKGEADLVIGSRALPNHKVGVSPAMRRISNNLSSFTISVIISFILPLASLFKYPIRWVRITDCTSGFRAVRRVAWHKSVLLSNGFEIETEMIYEAARNKLTIVEVPIKCNWDSRFSRLSITRDGLKTIKLMIRKLISDIGGRRA